MFWHIISPSAYFCSNLRFVLGFHFFWYIISPSAYSWSNLWFYPFCHDSIWPRWSFDKTFTWAASALAPRPESNSHTLLLLSRTLIRGSISERVWSSFFIFSGRRYLWVPMSRNNPCFSIFCLYGGLIKWTYKPLIRPRSRTWIKPTYQVLLNWV